MLLVLAFALLRLIQGLSGGRGCAGRHGRDTGAGAVSNALGSTHGKRRVF
ncbi:MAG: hypothetical protein VB099_00370 [Candidatus Limiplasma sp.]|nr:hypothetical protein [Candidatus Limiplasma sp.]